MRVVRRHMTGPLRPLLQAPWCDFAPTETHSPAVGLYIDKQNRLTIVVPTWATCDGAYFEQEEPQLLHGPLNSDAVGVAVQDAFHRFQIRGNDVPESVFADYRAGKCLGLGTAVQFEQRFVLVGCHPRYPDDAIGRACRLHPEFKGADVPVLLDPTMPASSFGSKLLRALEAIRANAA